jgi:SAM-dependent methyltransferase
LPFIPFVKGAGGWVGVSAFRFPSLPQLYPANFVKGEETIPSEISMTLNSTPTPPRPATWYQRFFAGAMARGRQRREPYYETRKRALFRDLHGDVLEIGPGAGPNLVYYPRDVRWTGMEPNPAMHPYLIEEARHLGMTIRLDSGTADAIPFPDNHFDAVVSTLVLCSVPDPRHTLQEIYRVLKPGGRFVFIEHVAAPPDTMTRRWQGFLKPLWKPLADGCHPDRETGATIESAGFREVKIEPFHLDFPIVGPHIAGYAVK